MRLPPKKILFQKQRLRKKKLRLRSRDEVIRGSTLMKSICFHSNMRNVHNPYPATAFTESAPGRTLETMSQTAYSLWQLLSVRQRISYSFRSRPFPYPSFHRLIRPFTMSSLCTELHFVNCFFRIVRFSIKKQHPAGQLLPSGWMPFHQIAEGRFELSTPRV